MRVLVRLVLIWLVLLSLPLKGVAGVVMVGCTPQHHGAWVDEGAAGAAGDLGGAAAAHAAHALPLAAGAGGAEPTAANAEPTSHHLDAFSLHGQCGSCAPCCAAAAPATELLLMVDPLPASAAVADLANRRLGFVTDAPERPPRRLLA